MTDEEIETFWRDGAVCLRNVIDPAWLDSLVQPIEVVLGDGKTVDLVAVAEAERVGGGTTILEDRLSDGLPAGKYALHTGSELDEIRRFEMESMLPEIAARVLRSSTIDLHVDQILVKEPGSPTRTAFHIDESYFNVSGEKVCTVWVPLDRVTVESGAMGFVRGSHRWAQAYLPNNFISQDQSASQAAMPGRVRLPDIEGHPEDFDIVYYECEPGDVTVHHYRTAHGSGGNTSRTLRRRALAVRFCGDDVRWAPAGPVPEGIRAFDNRLQPGDPLDFDGLAFPRAWPPATVRPDAAG